MKHFFILLFVITSITANSQDFNNVLYFKNGNVIHGEIIEHQNDFVKIKNHYSDILVFKTDEIDSIKEEKISVPNNQNIKVKNKGYYNQTGFGKLINYSNRFSYWGGYEPTHLINSFTSINGYKYMNYYAGLGIGVELENEISFPLFVEFKYILDRGKVNPMFFFQSGYVLPHKFKDEPSESASIEYFGGIMYNPGIGIQFALNDKTTWYLTTSYRHQKQKRIETYDDSTPREIKEFINRAVIRVGIQFF